MVSRAAEKMEGGFWWHIKNTELIKKFNVVRDYIRDFFLYGYKKRGDFEEKSKRTYEEHYGRSEAG